MNKKEEYSNKINNLKKIFAGAVKTLKEDNNVSGFREIVQKVRDESGLQHSINLIRKAEINLGFRKPEIAIYDHTFDIIGGGEKYGATMAAALQDKYNVTIISNRPVTPDQIKKWYNLDLSKCSFRNIYLDYFEENQCAIDPGRVYSLDYNPFDPVSKISGDYDVFINNSMNEMVYPLSPLSLMICHFPERRPFTYFSPHMYSRIIFNSVYTSEWIKKRWKLSPHIHLYPPVDMDQGMKSDKKNQILSVARFEKGGSKKQLEMVRAFKIMSEKFPETTKGWKLVLSGGSQPGNEYLQRVKEEAGDCRNIEIKTSISDSELKELYRESSVFWHLCGLNQNDPSLVEHFGMTIGEAMQNHIVPVVFNGGGQREIVTEGCEGFLVKDPGKLIKNTLELIRSRELRNNLSEASYKKSREFSKEIFTERTRNIIRDLINEEIFPEV